MTVYALASAKSSPGVTTLTVALAHVWPSSRRVVVAELDPGGGDLATRWELAPPGQAPKPGLLSLGIAARRSPPSADDLAAHVQRRGELEVLAAPPRASQAILALSALQPHLPALLASVDGDVLVDCGRLEEGSPLAALALAADILVLVVRPTSEELPRAGALLRGLEEQGARGALVLVGEGQALFGNRYTTQDVVDQLGVQVIGVVPFDRRGAEFLGGSRPGSERLLEGSQLIRSARRLAPALAAWLERDDPAGHWEAMSGVVADVVGSDERQEAGR